MLTKCVSDQVTAIVNALVSYAVCVFLLEMPALAGWVAGSVVYVVLGVMFGVHRWRVWRMQPERPLWQLDGLDDDDEDAFLRTPLAS